MGFELRDLLGTPSPAPKRNILEGLVPTEELPEEGGEFRGAGAARGFTLPEDRHEGGFAPETHARNIAAGTLEGIASGADTIAAFADPTGESDTFNAAAASLREAAYRIEGQEDTVGKMLAKGVGSSAPGIAISLALAPVSPSLAILAGATTAGIMEAGEVANRAIANGDSPTVVRSKVLAAALATGAMERVALGGISRTIRGAFKPGMSQAAKITDAVLGNAAREGVTEAAQNLVVDAIALSYNPDIDVWDREVYINHITDRLMEAGKEGLIGAFTGGVFGVSGVAINIESLSDENGLNLVKVREAVAKGVETVDTSLEEEGYVDVGGVVVNTEALSDEVGVEGATPTEAAPAVEAEGTEDARLRSASRAAARAIEDTPVGLEAKLPRLTGLRKAAAAAKLRFLDAADRMDARGLPVIANIARKFAYGGLAGPEFVELRGKQSGRLVVRAARNHKTFKRLSKALRKAPEETQTEAWLTLTGQSDGATLPQSLREAVLDARQTIDGMSRQIRDEVAATGVTTETEAAEGTVVDSVLNEMQATIDANLGSYVRRFYKASHVSNYLRRIANSPQMARAVEYLVKEEGITEEDAIAELHSWLLTHTQRTRRTLRKARSDGQTTVPRSPLLRRKNLAKPLRELLGEVEQTDIVAEKTLHDLARVIENFQFLRDVAEYRGPNNERFAFDKPSQESGALHRVPQQAKYGALAGKYVTAEIYEALEDYHVDFADPTLGAWERFVGRPFRKVKTVYNPGTHGRNIIGNTIFAELANCSILNPANWEYYAKGVRALADKNSAEFKDLAESGSLGTQFFQSPLLERALNHMERYINTERSVWNTLRNAGQTFDGAITNLYIAEDQIFRAAAYFKQRARGASTQKAARWTNLFFPDYASNPEILKMAERNAVTRPFLSFFVATGRIAANGWAHNPVKMGMVSALAASAALGHLLKMFADEFDEDELKTWGEARVLLPRYAQFSVPYRRDGKLKIINLQYTFPFADLYAFGQEMGQDPTSAIIEQFISGSPAVELWSKLTYGKGAMGFPARMSLHHSRPVMAPEGPPTSRSWDENLAILGVHMAETLSPPIIPWTGHEGNRLLRGLIGEPDRKGRVQDLSDAVTGQFGMRPQDISWDSNYHTEMWKAIIEYDTRIDELRRRFQAPGITPDEIATGRASLQRHTTRYVDRVGELGKALAAAQKLGGTTTMPAKLMKPLKTRALGVISEARNLGLKGGR